MTQEQEVTLIALLMDFKHGKTSLLSVINYVILILERK